MSNSFELCEAVRVYSIDSYKGLTILCYIILLKYTDTNSLNKIFSLLPALYNFSPNRVTTGFNMTKSKASKKAETFKKTPYVIYGLFNYKQTILKKMKKINILEKYMNKISSEILTNLGILKYKFYRQY